jgi:hypothetical protein
MQVDSINGCIITGNRDLNATTVPSLLTYRSHASGGSYIIGGNYFSDATPVLDPLSSYQSAGGGYGWALQSGGSTSAQTGAGQTFNHNMNCGLVPDVVLITQFGANLPIQAFAVTARTATTVTVAYPTSGAIALSYQCMISR